MNKPVTVNQAYRYALDPTPGQERGLARHAGAARFAFNWGLALVKACLAQREADKTYDVGDELLTPVPWNLYELRKRWNQAKHQAAPWWRECSKEAYNSGLDALARALRGFTDSRSGKRAGKRVGFPRFKSRRRSRTACRFTTGVIRIEPDRKHVTLPRLGTIKLHESARKLARRVEAGTARILSATVSRDSRGRWHAAFTCEVIRHAGRPGQAGRLGEVIGVDAGVTSLAVLSRPVPGLSDDDGKIANPRRLSAITSRLRRLQRRAACRHGPYDPATRTRREPSKRWQATQRRIGRLHGRVRDARADGWHKLTSALAQRFDTIVVEDLNVAGMLTAPTPKPDRHGRYLPNGRAAKRGLARSLSDAAPAELRRQLSYKTGWYGSALHAAGRFYPSSKTCSACAAVKPKLPLSPRLFTCDNCGLTLDRDVNAARNLAQLAAGHGTGSAPETRPRTGPHARGDQVRPAPHQRDGHRSMKREARTSPQLDQTGSLRPQGRSAPTIPIHL
ncbi:MAG TPA: IS607 family element RNA-guided endonuclease TnpB [Candidatus Limnocylindrales bacterium]